jgi:hypothetical protein
MPVPRPGVDGDLSGELPVTIDFFNVLNDPAALMLVRDARLLVVSDKPQRDALAMFLRGFTPRSDVTRASPPTFRRGKFSFAGFT